MARFNIFCFNWNFGDFWLHWILPLDFFVVGDCGTGLFCYGRLCHWTFLLWEILMLDFFAVGDSDARLSS